MEQKGIESFMFATSAHTRADPGAECQRDIGMDSKSARYAGSPINHITRKVWRGRKKPSLAVSSRGRRRMSEAKREDELSSTELHSDTVQRLPGGPSDVPIVTNRDGSAGRPSRGD